MDLYTYKKITKIELVEDVEMVDIEVSGNNLFFANNILVHNSAISNIRENKSLGQDHIQGGISKINTADLVIALVKDEAMDAAGEYRFEFLKARNSRATNKKLTMAFDQNTLRVTDYNVSPKDEIDKSKDKKKISLRDTLPGQKPENGFF